MTTSPEEDSVGLISWREALRRVRIQLVVLAVLLGVYLVDTLGIMPAAGQQLLRFLETGGVIVIVPISFVENIFGFNVFFPGSIAILTSMALTAGDPQRAVVVLLAIMLPAFAAHQINYFVGRGLERTDPGVGGRRYESALSRNIIFCGALWHPHFAALACIDAGAHGVSYVRFISGFAPWFVVWNFFWGYVMYNFGTVVARESSGNYVLVAFLFVWLLWDLFNLGSVSRALGARIKASLLRKR